MFFYLVSIIVILSDQALKFFVKAHLPFSRSVPILGNYIKLTYVKNSGAAFSFFSGYSTWLVIIGLAVAALVIYFHRRLPQKNYLLQFALAAILGGSMGNIIDRIFFHAVIDYIDLTYWPIFNLADIMINVGIATIFYAVIIKGNKNASDPI